MRLLYIIFSAFLATSAYAEAESQFRVGIGRTFLYNDPARSYSRSADAWHYGWLANADYSHNNYFAARSYLYRFDGRNDVQGWGGELQLLAGYGLAGDGVRIYTGPTYIREARKDMEAIHEQFNVFQGLGWNVGTGYQWQRWSFDATATVRDNTQFVNYYEEKNVQLSKDEVWAVASFATISYQL